MCTCMLVSVHLGAQVHTCVCLCTVCYICGVLACVYTNVHGYMNVHENIWPSVSLGECE